MSKKELDSITKQDLDFLTSVIIDGKEPSVESVPTLINICNILSKSKKFSIIEIDSGCDVRGYYYVDAGFGNMEVIGDIELRIEDGRQFCKYLKEYGSGKYDADLNEYIEENDWLNEGMDWGIGEVLEFSEEGMEQLPSFLYFGEEDEDERIEVKSIRDDIELCDCINKCYYYQP